MTTKEPETLPGPSRAADQLLTIQEVSEVVRVPVATLRYWRHLGVGPHGFRIGRGVRYWRTDLIHWLEQQSTHPQTPR